MSSGNDDFYDDVTGHPTRRRNQPGRLFIPPLGRSIRLAEMHALYETIPLGVHDLPETTRLRFRRNAIPAGCEWALMGISVEPNEDYRPPGHSERAPLGVLDFKVNDRLFQFDLNLLMDASYRLFHVLPKDEVSHLFGVLREVEAWIDKNAEAEQMQTAVEGMANAVQLISARLASSQSMAFEPPRRLTDRDQIGIEATFALDKERVTLGVDHPRGKRLTVHLFGIEQRPLGV